MGKEKLVFVAHPVSNDPTYNAVRGLAKLRELMDEYPDCSFVAPWIDYILVLNDTRMDHRKRGIRDDLTILKRCDELWLTGTHVSTGMKGEKELAESLGITVRDLTAANSL